MSEFKRIKLKSLKIHYNFKAANQINFRTKSWRFYTFRTKLGKLIWTLPPTALEVFQINLGKMCNLRIVM
jgi:hypothetical protein